ncbi:MAG TPA: hypothetical protein VGO62_05870, partial [Myxococcota bacterium]
MIVAAQPAFTRSEVLERSRVLLVEADTPARRALLRTLRSTVGDTSAADSFTRDDLANVDVLAIALHPDPAERARITRIAAEHPRHPHVLWIGAGVGPADYADMFTQRQVRNLIARNDGLVHAGELIATLHKLLEPTIVVMARKAPAIFGLDKY